MDNKDNKESGREFSRSSSREEFESKDADAGGKMDLKAVDVLLVVVRFAPLLPIKH